LLVACLQRVVLPHSLQKVTTSLLGGNTHAGLLISRP